MTLDIPALRDRMTGTVVTPDDPMYDQTRQVFEGGVDRHPSVIFQVADAADVSRALALAGETGLELAVRSGGHGAGGLGTTEGGIVIDVRGLKDLEVDPVTQTVWAGSGLTAEEFTHGTFSHGLVTGLGDTGSVGLGGITLGGGIGYLVRKHGLTIDSLLAAEVVTADGEILTTDDEAHPDLFWAIRGGGGNFGVATRFRFRLHPIDTLLGGMLVLPATTEVVAGFVAECEAAPDELSTIGNVMVCPPMPFFPGQVHGKLVVLAMIAWSGETDAGEKVVGRLRSLAEPLVDMVGPIPYPQMYPPEDPEYRPVAASRTLFTDSFDEATAAMALDRLEASDASVRVTQIRALGGAMARVPNDATAFAHRNRRLMINVAAFIDEPDQRERRESWVADLAGALGDGDQGGYVGFIGDEGPERTRAAYPGDTWDRLRRIKAKYDPANLFRLNQNIPPD